MLHLNALLASGRRLVSDPVKALPHPRVAARPVLGQVAGVPVAHGRVGCRSCGAEAVLKTPGAALRFFEVHPYFCANIV